MLSHRPPSSVRLMLVVLSVIALGACGRSAPPEPAPRPAETAAQAAPDAAGVESEPADATATAPPNVAADPGPRLTRRTGATTVRLLPAKTVGVRAIGITRDGHHYAESMPLATVIDLQSQEVGAWGRELSVEIGGARHGVAALTSGEEASILLRLVGKEVPESLALTLVIRPSRFEHGLRPETRVPLTLTGFDGAAKEADLPARFWEALARRFEHDTWGGPAFPWSFEAFAAGRARLLAGAAAAGRPGVERPARRGPVAEVMSLYTGVASMEEALQVDRGLRLGAESFDKPTVPLSELTPVPLAAHPWDELLAARPAAVVEPLAAYVPEGFLYAHCASVGEALAVLDDLDELIAPAGVIVDRHPGQRPLQARTEAALMVERGEVERLLGAMAVSAFAIATSDPFLADGGDVTLLFQVKDRALFDASLATYASHARERHADLAAREIEIGGRKVTVSATPDGTVRQHRVDLGEVTILSTSRAALERVLAVADARAPALADAKDFRYFRTFYPAGGAGDEGESAFVFASDAFVAAAVSPRARVLAARRRAAAADLEAVDHAALWHAFLEGPVAGGAGPNGALPASAGALVELGAVTMQELVHGDGAPIGWTPEGGASSRWGRPGALTPLVELPLERVTVAEKEAFEEFARTYQQYWRTWIDPIGVRVHRSGKTTRLDARILPLIEGSSYDELVEAVGRARVVPGRIVDGLQWTLAVGADATLRRELDGLAHFGGARDIGFGWLGDFVVVGLGSRAGLVDAALAAELVLELSADETGRKEREARTRHLAQTPVLVGVQVRDRAVLGLTLTALRAMVMDSAPGLLTWQAAGAHREVPITEIKALQSGDLAEVGDLALRYAVAGDMLLASLDLPTLQGAIDAVLDGHGPRAVERGEDEGVQAHLALGLPGAGGYLAQVVGGLLEVEGRESLGAALRDLELLGEALGALPVEREARDALAQRFLGYLPETPLGPVEACASGAPCRVRHAQYGSRAEPALPAGLPEGTPLGRLVAATAGLELGLSFEGKGASRGLHATLSWTRAR